MEMDRDTDHLQKAFDQLKVTTKALGAVAKNARSLSIYSSELEQMYSELTIVIADLIVARDQRLEPPFARNTEPVYDGRLD